ncbi:glycoside hydrolase family 3 N-terminal domain-containing protein [Hyphomonas johnsonii]|uniref:Beta-D-glucoside glucohydrolase n=1 Tax=Hyphomonas johnsonii MHS-2 TaxID=1280950 RepID=A0A059FUD8_9PROT|nr:glycoside hydrolase family 3 N-terminal domain-containing protein [Hyphomonas johnsonii]KCZ94111.1 Beta-glucosidase [Hyphomonas johnsonii MHS-2]
MGKAAVVILLIAASGCGLTGAAAPLNTELADEGRTTAGQATANGLRGAERVEFILERMAVEEKLGQLNQMAGGRQIALNSRITDAEYDRVRAGGVGSYLHVAGAEFLGGLQRVAVEESRHGIPLLFAMDVVHGYRTIFPVPLGIAATFDTVDADLAARVAAVEASGAGLHWTFAPMVDIARDARWGRIVEGAGEEPFFGSAMARAQVHGYQDGDLTRADTIIATAKHFGAYGAGAGGRDYDSADISRRTLMDVYLPPFRAAAEEGAASFMVAFNDIGGVPTTANKALLNDLLRDEWAYEGLVVSDWNAVPELMNHGVAETRAQAGALALSASVDMEMTSGIYAGDMLAAVKASPTLQAALDASARRVLMAKERLGLFDNPYAYNDPDREAAVMLTPDHRAAARHVAERSLVLLRNDERLLPLKAAPGKVAVIGALADDARSMIGSWKAQGREEDVITLVDALRTRLGEAHVVYEPGAGARDPADPAAIGRAVAAAEAADVVILVTGEDYNFSGEARSRSDIGLPASQRVLAEAILATGKPVATVLMTGRPLDLGPLDHEGAAILVAWFPGVEAGPAVADVLFGDVSPAGRLPASFPRRTGQSPSFIGHYPTGRPADEDLSKDSARYMDTPITPAYAFGHGLSYATFEYGNLQLSGDTLAPGDTLTISADVTNTSRTDSDEVVQLYVRDPVAQVARPQQELRGFARVPIDAGKTKRVAFTLRPEQFAYFAPSDKFEVDAGRIDFGIGAGSADIRLSGSFQITAPVMAGGPAAALATPVSILEE